MGATTGLLREPPPTFERKAKGHQKFLTPYIPSNDDTVKPDLGVEPVEMLISLLEAMTYWGWIAIIAIGVTAIEAVVKIKRMQIKHAERMEKIQQGIDPGDETEAYKKDGV